MTTQLKCGAKTHLEKVREKHSALNESVRKELGWTEMQYNDYQLEKGIEYLKSRNLSESTYQALIDSRLYWKWWVNHWSRRNEYFLYNVAEYLIEVNPETGIAPMEGINSANIYSGYECINSMEWLEKHTVLASSFNYICQTCLAESRSKIKKQKEYGTDGRK